MKFEISRDGIFLDGRRASVEDVNDALRAVASDAFVVEPSIASAWIPATVRCSVCGRYQKASIHPVIPARDTLRVQGWAVGLGGEAVCPDCLHRSETEGEGA